MRWCVLWAHLTAVHVSPLGKTSVLDWLKRDAISYACSRLSYLPTNPNSVVISHSSSWLLRLRYGSVSAAVLLPAPTPILHMSAPVRRSAAADARLIGTGSGVLFDLFSCLVVVNFWSSPHAWLSPACGSPQLPKKLPAPTSRCNSQ